MLSIDSPNFKPTKDYVFVHADKDKTETITLKSGLKLYQDRRFRPMHRGNAVQDGVVRKVPMKLTSKQPIEIAVGDHIYFHHFTVAPENEVEINGELLYHCSYSDSIYCKVVDGKIVMLNDYNFIEAVAEEEKSTIIITPDSAKKNSSSRGIIRHVNKELQELSVKEGDTIVFTKNSDYDIDVEGTMYYCMKSRDIVAVITE